VTPLDDVGLALAGVTVLIALAVASIWASPFSRDASTAMNLTRATLALVGFVGAGLRAFPVSRKADEDFPVVDLTTLAFLVLILVAFLLPRISKIKVGDTEIELIEAAEELKQSAVDYSGLLQNWMFLAGYAIEELRDQTDEDDASDIFFKFVRDCLGDLKRSISTTEQSPMRLTLWIYDPRADVLRFGFSNEIDDAATMSRTFGPREGFVGEAFAEQRSWNESKATELPTFVWIRPDVPYQAIAAAPVSLFQRGLGMLTVDKADENAFGPAAANLIEGCARMLAIVLDEYLETLSVLEAATISAQEAGQ
jgi:hypothetical protein